MIFCFHGTQLLSRVFLFPGNRHEISHWSVSLFQRFSSRTLGGIPGSCGLTGTCLGFCSATWATPACSPVAVRGSRATSCVFPVLLFLVRSRRTQGLNRLPKYSCESRHFRHSFALTLTPPPNRLGLSVNGRIERSGISARPWNTPCRQLRGSEAAAAQKVPPVALVLNQPGSSGAAPGALFLRNGLFCALFITVTFKKRRKKTFVGHRKR